MKRISTKRFYPYHLHGGSHADYHRTNLLIAEEEAFENERWTTLLGSYRTELNTLTDISIRPTGSTYTPDIRAADAVRDRTMRQLFLSVAAAAQSSLPAEREAAQKLLIRLRLCRGVEPQAARQSGDLQDVL